MRELGYGICEVVFSRWAEERAARAEASARRIWGEQFEETYRGRSFASRHFVFLFHDTTSECLADDLQVALSTEPVGSLLVERAKGMAID